MHALTASELLKVWERGFHMGPVRQALDLLQAACPEIARAEELSIGRRDALLLRLRQFTFGRELTGMWHCGECGEQIELTFAAPDLLMHESSQDPIEFTTSGYELRLRPVNSADVEAVADPDLARARRTLLERCLLASSFEGAPISVLEMPETLIDDIERRLAKADPHSEILLAAQCPACRRRNRVTFDITSFFWREIESWAMRTLREVHTLASAYHWAEEEILALSPLRRRCYLDLVGA